MQAYDPAYAGQQVAAQGQAQADQNMHIPAAQGQPPRYPEQNHYQQRDAGFQENRGSSQYDDGNTAMELAGYQPRYAAAAPQGALEGRIGPRLLPNHDVWNKLDRIHNAELI